MRQLNFARITTDELVTFAAVDDHGATRDPWVDLAQGEITDGERAAIAMVLEGLKRFPPGLVNDATIRARVVVPLLALVEVDRVAAYADVPLHAKLSQVELNGVADVALGQPFAGELRAPFLIVVEAKRGIEAHNPVPQLYGELLAAAWQNGRDVPSGEQVLYGCYTVGDCWTFVHARVGALDTDRPSLVVRSSPEYATRSDAETIVRTLKSIVAQGVKRAN